MEYWQRTRRPSGDSVSRYSLFVALLLNLAVAATHTSAQQTTKLPIVGYLSLATGADDPIAITWRQSLLERGYVDGKNIKFEFRGAQGHPERLPDLAQELVKLNADVIFVGSALSAQALQRATSTIPIVVALFDPVASGLVTNVAHPGGNVTGVSFMNVELRAKQLQLLKETIPWLTRVAVLWNPAMLPTPLQVRFVDDLKAAARSLSIELKFVVAQQAGEFDAAFSALSRTHAQALYVIENPLFYVHRMTVAELALKARLPAIFGTSTFVDVGGLMSYGARYTDQMRRSAAYIDKILKGAKPGDLPIEQPTELELVVNLKTANALGLTIPQSILARADGVIR